MHRISWLLLAFLLAGCASDLLSPDPDDETLFWPTLPEGQDVADVSRFDVADDGSIFAVGKRGFNSIHNFSPDGTRIRQWELGDSDVRGIALGPFGSVYVVLMAEGTGVVVGYTQRGRRVGPVVGLAGGQPRLLDPVDVRVTNTGTILVADAERRTVESFSPDGTHLDSWTVDTQEAGDFDIPHRLDVRPNGRVAVLGRLTEGAGSGTGDSVQVFDEDGSWVRSFRADRSGESIRWTDDGRISILDDERIEIWSPQGIEGEFVSGTGPNDPFFLAAEDHAFSADGNLYYTESSVERFHTATMTGSLARSTKPPFSQTEIWNPLDLAIASDGTVLVLDSARGVRNFAFNGELLNEVFANSFWARTMASDREGRIALRHFKAPRIAILDESGTVLESWFIQGPPVPALSLSYALTFGPDGNLWIPVESTLYVFEPTGDPVRSFEPIGVDAAPILDVANDDRNRVLVLQPERILVLDAAGIVLDTWSFDDAGIGRVRPMRIKAREGYVVVTDEIREEYLTYDDGGNFIGITSTQLGNLATGRLSVAIANTGHVFLADSVNHYVTRVPPVR